MSVKVHGGVRMKKERREVEEGKRGGEKSGKSKNGRGIKKKKRSKKKSHWDPV